MEYMDELVELQPDSFVHIGNFFAGCVSAGSFVYSIIIEKITKTTQTILYDFGGLEVWLPKSQITELDNGWCVECPLWLAVDKGLESYAI